MYRYSAFGLNIASDVRLDELTPLGNESAPIDLRIVQVETGCPVPPIHIPPEMDFDSGDGVTMLWPGAARVHIKSTELIEIRVFPEIPERYLAFPILGPAMGWLLHMRGLFVLHASAVSANGFAVAFLGDKGAGKSTTGSVFLQHGWELVTDDLLAITISEEGVPQMQTAFGQLKLNADAPTAAIPNAKVLPLVMEGFQKRQYRLDSLAQGPLKADCIFVLSRGGDEVSVEWLSPERAIAELIRYSYNVRFSDASVEQQDRARQFRQAVAIANSVRVGRLHIPHAHDRLPETVAFVSEIAAGRQS